VFEDGRRRHRGIPLSEKMLPSEDAQTAARRGIAEELGSALGSSGCDDAVHVRDRGEPTQEHSISPSYPGSPARCVARAGRRPHRWPACAVCVVTRCLVLKLVARTLASLSQWAS
jgi:hypothetical protein